MRIIASGRSQASSTIERFWVLIVRTSRTFEPFEPLK
jgi:hypothetical protein